MAPGGWPRQRGALVVLLVPARTDIRSVGARPARTNVLDDADACVIPDVHAEGKVRLGFHGQVRLDSSWPAGIYTLCCRVLSKVKNGP
jgi:hypothetical protein